MIFRLFLPSTWIHWIRVITARLSRDDVERGRINCVVVKDLSRLGRNAIDSGYYIEKYFPLHQVRFIAVNDQYTGSG